MKVFKALLQVLTMLLVFPFAAVGIAGSAVWHGLALGYVLYVEFVDWL